MQYDVIIIGAGPAGLSAAIYTTRKDLKILVLCKQIGGQVSEAWEIENYLGLGKIKGIDFAQKMKEHIALFENIEVKENTIVNSVDNEENSFKVRTKTGDFLSRTVLITSGSKPKKLGAKNEADLVGKGISYCATCDASLFKGKEGAVVIGGGNSALQAALELSSLVKNVYILDIDLEFSGDEKLSNQISLKKNIKSIHGVKVVSFENDDKGWLEELIYEDVKKNKTSLIVQGAFIEIGTMPALIKNAVKLNDKNEIIIDENNMTTLPGIFAAGDVTNTKYKQIAISVGEGAKAGLAVYEYLNSH